jgi:tRNA-2-methylthio-N6-dimethylallyladenosine synthase
MTAANSFFIKTYGCQMNERDSESVQVLLSARGFSASPSEGEAGVILINTCSVRGKAEDKSIGKARLLVAQKRIRPGLRVGLFGCMVQRLKEDLFDLIPGLDFAVGPHRLGLLPDVLASVLAGEGPRLEVGEERSEGDVLRGHRDGAMGAFVNILYGCNRRCAYCIVPTVRGGEWSRPAADVVAEVRRLADGGVREITLLGQSVMSYGRTNAVWPEGEASPGGFTEPFARLLEAVHAAAGGAWIRFTSGHPSGCTAEVARAMGTLPLVCPHLHLPLQSGSDRILARMRRGYDAEGYRQAVARLRAQVPNLVLTTDVIVGFPGETEEDFEATRQLVGEIGFVNAFIFKYSPRPGTPAADWEDTVSADEKMRRNQVLLEDIDRQALTLHARWIGSDLETLVEGVSRRNSDRWAGRTRYNITAIFPKVEGLHPGDRVKVRIERVRAQTLYGQVQAESNPANGAAAG